MRKFFLTVVVMVGIAAGTLLSGGSQMADASECCTDCPNGSYYVWHAGYWHKHYYFSYTSYYWHWHEGYAEWLCEPPYEA